MSSDQPSSRSLLRVSSCPRQLKSGSAMTSTAIFTRSGANLFAWCPQKISSPPPARTIRSLPAAEQRSQRSSAAGGAAASGGGVSVGVIASSSAGRGSIGDDFVDSSFTHRPTSGPLTTFPELGVATEVTGSVSRGDDGLHLSSHHQHSNLSHSYGTVGSQLHTVSDGRPSD